MFKFWNTVTPVLFYIFVSGIAISCKNRSGGTYYQISGPTMGTKYHITIQAEQPEKVQASVDSILEDFNLSMSAYIDNSTLTLFNNADSIFCYDPAKDPYFEPVFLRSKEVFSQTGGAFDPSISPLARYYGFGTREKRKPAEVDTLEVKRLMNLLVFDSLVITRNSTGQNCIKKPNKEVKLDFNAISPGYAVDVLALFFDSKSIINYMIEVGGEIRTRGVNDRNNAWVIGINRPSEKAKETDVEIPVIISGKSLATSGNYRNSYQANGVKYVHIVNPYTGKSQPSDILSATVIADDCTSADGYATAFMVMGLEKAIKLAENIQGIEACFIYDKEGDGVFEFMTTTGFENFYLHNEQK